VNDETILQSKVRADEAGATLLKYLAGRFRYQTKAQWRELIFQGKVTVNGKKAQPNHPLGKGSIVAYSVILKEPQVDTNIQIIHEEDTFLVASKPGNLPSHADGNYIKNTFVYILNQRLAESGWKGKAHLVHRLDRETSGLMIVAKEKEALANLTNQFEKGAIDKEYLAIVEGSIVESTWEISGALARDNESQISVRQKVVSLDTPDSKPALTQFKKLKTFGPYHLIQCFPKTGRTNQIRVHLASTNNPILGDKLYGKTDEQFLEYVHAVKEGTFLPDLEVPRQFLHASRIVFAHPQNGERLAFSCPLPDDMENFIQKYAE
jgi:RluA family pseudouridine synthase